MKNRYNVEQKVGISFFNYIYGYNLTSNDSDNYIKISLNIFSIFIFI